jgi:predicted DNA-binding transcriptional regulator AlpA
MEAGHFSDPGNIGNMAKPWVDSEVDASIERAIAERDRYQSAA